MSQSSLSPSDSIRISTGSFDPWYHGCPIGTMAFNAMSLHFPIMERFVIQSVRHYRHQVPEALRHEIAEFIHEEASHSGWHRQFNAMLSHQGLQTEELEQGIRRTLVTLTHHLSPLSQLAITISGEGFTASLAQVLLTQMGAMKGVDPLIAQMWVRHAEEEIAHKDLALTVYKSIGGKGLRQRLFVPCVKMVLGILMTRTTYRLLKQIQVPFAGYKAIHWLWCKPGFLRKGMRF